MPDGSAMSVKTTAAFGELIITYTSSFSYRWNDLGSGGRNNGSFWHPVAPKGFAPLGSIGFKGYDDPNGRQWAMCIAPTGGNNTAVANPVDYVAIWTDHGSGSHDDGSCWQPVAPEGYVALGAVFNSGYDKPSLTDVVCVRKDLVTDGVIGDLIWDDTGTGSDVDFGAWSIAVTNRYTDAGAICLAPNTFIGAPSHDRPTSRVFVLRLPPPTIVNQEPPVPELTSRTAPASFTPGVIDRVVTIPFTAVSDTLDLATILSTTPFYTIEREASYRLVLFYDNHTNVAQKAETSVEVGVPVGESKAYEVKTGIQISYESGVEVGPVSSKVSGTISSELGFSSTTSVSNFKPQTISAEINVQSQHAGALWVAQYTLTVRRADGTPVGAPLVLDSNGSFVGSEFPHAQQATPVHFVP